MLKKYLTVFILVTLSAALHAHPHSQILVGTDFVFKDGVIDGFWAEWEFDIYFSSDIIMSFDLDDSGDFSPEEIKDIYSNAFISLDDYQYFTYIRVGDKRWSPDYVTDFSPYIAENGAIVYKFYISLADIKEKDFYISVYDFTYYCACFYQEEEPVTFTDDIDGGATYSIEKNEDYPIYFNPYAGPDDLTVYTEMEEGLVELVIQEIHVKY